MSLEFKIQICDDSEKNCNFKVKYYKFYKIKFNEDTIILKDLNSNYKKKINLNGEKIYDLCLVSTPFNYFKILSNYCICIILENNYLKLVDIYSGNLINENWIKSNLKFKIYPLFNNLERIIFGYSQFGDCILYDLYNFKQYDFCLFDKNLYLINTTVNNITISDGSVLFTLSDISNFFILRLYELKNFLFTNYFKIIFVKISISDILNDSTNLKKYKFPLEEETFIDYKKDSKNNLVKVNFKINYLYLNNYILVYIKSFIYVVSPEELKKNIEKYWKINISNIEKIDNLRVVNDRLVCDFNNENYYYNLENFMNLLIDKDCSYQLEFSLERKVNKDCCLNNNNTVRINNDLNSILDFNLYELILEKLNLKSENIINKLVTCFDNNELYLSVVFSNYFIVFIPLYLINKNISIYYLNFNYIKKVNNFNIKQYNGKIIITINTKLILLNIKKFKYNTSYESNYNDYSITLNMIKNTEEYLNIFTFKNYIKKLKEIEYIYDINRVEHHNNNFITITFYNNSFCIFDVDNEFSITDNFNFNTKIEKIIINRNSNNFYVLLKNKPELIIFNYDFEGYLNLLKDEKLVSHLKSELEYFNSFKKLIKSFCKYNSKSKIDENCVININKIEETYNNLKCNFFQIKNFAKEQLFNKNNYNLYLVYYYKNMFNNLNICNKIIYKNYINNKNKNEFNIHNITSFNKSETSLNNSMSNYDNIGFEDFNNLNIYDNNNCKLSNINQYDYLFEFKRKHEKLRDIDLDIVKEYLKEDKNIYKISNNLLNMSSTNSLILIHNNNVYNKDNENIKKVILYFLIKKLNKIFNWNICFSDIINEEFKCVIDYDILNYSFDNLYCHANKFQIIVYFISYLISTGNMNSNIKSYITNIILNIYKTFIEEDKSKFIINILINFLNDSFLFSSSSQIIFNIWINSKKHIYIDHEIIEFSKNYLSNFKNYNNYDKLKINFCSKIEILCLIIDFIDNININKNIPKITYIDEYIKNIILLIDFKFCILQPYFIITVIKFIYEFIPFWNINNYNIIDDFIRKIFFLIFYYGLSFKENSEFSGFNYLIIKDNQKLINKYIKFIDKINIQDIEIRKNLKTQLFKLVKILFQYYYDSFFKIFNELIDDYVNESLIYFNIVDILRYLIRIKSPKIFENLDIVINIIIKTLDPNKPECRKFCQNFVTQTFNSILNRTELLSFHHQTQKLYLANKNKLILYDLRTALKWKTINTNTDNIISIALNTNGDKIFTLTKSKLYIWKINNENFLFSFLKKEFSLDKEISLNLNYNNETKYILEYKGNNKIVLEYNEKKKEIKF